MFLPTPPLLLSQHTFRSELNSSTAGEFGPKEYTPSIAIGGGKGGGEGGDGGGNGGGGEGGGGTMYSNSNHQGSAKSSPRSSI